MTNQGKESTKTSSSKVAKPELAPRLVLFFAALFIGAVVAISFGHGLNIYGYRMNQSALEITGKREYLVDNKGKAKMRSKEAYKTVTTSSDPDNRSGYEAVKEGNETFILRFSFSPEQLFGNHIEIFDHKVSPNEKCEDIFVDGNAVSPVSEIPYGSNCVYSYDYDDFFTWEIVKPKHRENK